MAGRPLAHQLVPDPAQTSTPGPAFRSLPSPRHSWHAASGSSCP